MKKTETKSDGTVSSTALLALIESIKAQARTATRESKKVVNDPCTKSMLQSEARTARHIHMQLTQLIKANYEYMRDSAQ